MLPFCKDINSILGVSLSRNRILSSDLAYLPRVQEREDLYEIARQLEYEFFECEDFYLLGFLSDNIYLIASEKDNGFDCFFMVRDSFNNLTPCYCEFDYLKDLESANACKFYPGECIGVCIRRLI